MCQPWEISNRMQCVSCFNYVLKRLEEEGNEP